MKSFNQQHRLFNAYKARVEVLNEKLIQKIEALPENPKINRISPNCFTINSKDLGTKNWTPFYHDFRYQYSFIRAIIENFDLNQIEQILMEIMNKGSYRLYKKITTSGGKSFTANETYYFHPDVIAYLKETL